MLRLSKQEWGKFYTLYGGEMYKDKLPMTARVCKEDPDYMNIYFGQGCDHNGYDDHALVKNSYNKGATQKTCKELSPLLS